jgi:hypothetical protein
MRKKDTLAQAIRVVTLCLPPVVMSLAGLAVLSRRPRGGTVVAGRQPRLAPPARPPGASR